jgi:hypothetical protein
VTIADEPRHREGQALGAVKAGVSRWTNLTLGILYAVVSAGNLIGETWAYYLLFGVLEIAITTLIVWYAWTWPRA